MIDLTPLDVRKKRGDFRRILRGYEPEEVDTFLQLVAERMEELVRENLAHSEKVARLQEQVGSMEGRERAVHDALVTAERLRSDVKEQAGREAEMVRREAEADARRILEDAERAVGEARSQLAVLERERRQFLASFRALVERQMERLETDEGSLEPGEGGARARDVAPSRRRPLAVGGWISQEPQEPQQAGPDEAWTEAHLPSDVSNPKTPLQGADSWAQEESSGSPVPAGKGREEGEGEGEGGAPAGGTENEGADSRSQGGTRVAREGRGAAGDPPPGEDLSSWLASFLEDEPPGR